jgi:hypothetical protein
MTVKWRIGNGAYWGWSIVGIGAIACVAASPLRFPLLSLLNRPSAIADIQAMPFWFRLPVCIEGIVGDRAPIVNGQLYQLKDSTGSIWIVSPDTGLQLGQAIKIKGTLQFQSIVIAGQEQGELYIEQDTSQLLTP